MKLNTLAAALVLTLVSASGSSVFAQTDVWTATGGGSWSNAANWSTGQPITSQAVTFNDAPSGQTVIYDSTASATSFGTLTMNQTTGSQINNLTIEKTSSFSGLSLNPSGGTVQIYVDQVTTAAGVTLTLPSFTLAAGDSVVLGAASISGGGSNLFLGSANTLTMTGGNFSLERGTNTTSTNYNLTGAFTMTGGNLSIGTTPIIGTAASTDNRLTVTGNVNITGGTITNANNGSLFFTGAANTINGVSLGASSNVGVTLNAETAQSYTSDQAQGNLTARGSGVKTFNLTGASKQVGSITMIDDQNVGGLNGGVTTLLLANNMVGNNGTSISAANFGTNGTTGHTYVLDTGSGNTLDFSRGSISLNNDGTGNTVATSWTLQGSGTIMAPTFNTSVATGTNGVIVGGTVTLQATGGNTTATNLSKNATAGSISAGSTFLYSGTAGLTTAATLVTNQTLGNLQVQNGALKLNQGAVTLAGGATISSSGTLDLGGAGTVGTLTLGTGTAFTVSTGRLVLDLGSTSDAVLGNNGTGSGGSFTLSGLTLAIDQGSGFSFGNSYQILQNFASGTALSGIALTDQNGTAITSQVGSISTAGFLSFSAVPEPSSWLLMGMGLTGLILAIRRRPLPGSRR